MTSTASKAQTLDISLAELGFLADGNPQKITKGTSKIYFAVNSLNLNRKVLWVYDSYTNQTHFVNSISPGDGIGKSAFVTINDIVYFSAKNSNNGEELWRSDGTETGTYQITNTNNNSNSITSIIAYNGKLIFNFTDANNGNEIWISDGTAIGTTLLKDISQGTYSSDVNDFFIFNNLLYFTAYNATNGREIWKTNGTTSGTVLVKDINPSGADGLNIGNDFIILNNNFYFYARNQTNGFELWKSDGTNAGTVLVKDIYSGINPSANVLKGTALGNSIIFRAFNSSFSYELWKTDGTSNGTVLLSTLDLNNESSNENYKFITLNGKAYFLASNAISGRELWTTDGTPIGTTLLKDIKSGSESSYISSLTLGNGIMLFAARSGNTAGFYKSLWRSDGTESGTFQLKEIDVNRYSSVLNFTEFNGQYFFPAYTTVNGIELWTTDGTPMNTILFKDCGHNQGTDPDYINEINGSYVFVANTTTGRELHKSDGTVNGTSILKDINPGEIGSIPFATTYGPSLKKAGNYLFFKANNGTGGAEIYKTDGTTQNTDLVKDITNNSQSGISDYTLFMEYNNIFYFKGNDQIHGEELWRSDGTESGTYLVKDINPGAGNAIDYTNITGINGYAVLNGYLYFTANDGNTKSIWKTDGTESGTIKVITIPSAGNYDLKGPVILNATSNKIFFTTNHTNSSWGNNSIWSTDGTQSGCQLLLESQSSSSISQSFIYDDYIYFQIVNSGIKLMKSDGTIGGTTVLNQGQNLYYNLFKICGSYLFFTKTSNSGLDELWRTDGTVSGTLKLVNSGTFQTSPIDICGCFNQRLVYQADTWSYEFWMTNGNADNVFPVSLNVINDNPFNYPDMLYQIWTIDDKIFVRANTASNGAELYVGSLSNLLSTTEVDDNFTLPSKTQTVIYPNPAHEMITISSNDKSNIESVTLYDLKGMKIEEADYNAEKVNLNLAKFAKGIYLVKIKTKNTTEIQKIILK
ncbi:T9SS type A sorting domain-containing protein [Flavobacterium sp.]|uniref:T9SS type A sorting domain-containing protein n=1 Tax=Flavobacterium sp. TaxID=239 RepID=UPI00261261ED|nr:T9SS type A sorting domain-containing protein [Flavobacterium sp.]